MIRKTYIKLFPAALVVLALSGEASARFFDVMSSSELSQEIRLWRKSGMSLEVTAQAAFKAGVTPERLTTNLIEGGLDAVTVVATLINVDPKSASAITAAAIRVAPKQTKAIYAAALTASGLDPSLALPATAAGGNDSAERR